MNRIRASVLALILAASQFTCPKLAQAGTGIYTYYWSDSHFTVSTTSGTYSNATGMWQAILDSRSCVHWIDGVFGSETKSATQAFQTAMGIPSTGVVDDWTWLFAYWWEHDGTRALASAGSAYGFDFYDYYGGLAVEAELAWSPGTSQWWFEIPVVTGTWYPATASRTMASHTHC